MNSFQYEINRLPKEIIDKMKETHQNTKYHPEGSLYNHSWMVYNSIMKDTSMKQIHLLKNDLLICAIFHDLGKINCTREKTIKDGSTHIIAYGHEHYAKEYLDKYLNFYPYSNREMIYKICKNHMRAHLFEKMREFKREIFKSTIFFNETMTFASFDDMSKVKIPKFVITIGIPGAGKSSWVKDLKDFVVVCPDNIRKIVTGDISNISQDREVWDLTKKTIKLNLDLGFNVILDSTMVKGKSRRDFLKDLPLCMSYAKVFECDPEESKRRIKNDIENNIDRSHVPDDVVDRMYEQFVNDRETIYFDGYEIL